MAKEMKMGFGTGRPGPWYIGPFSEEAIHRALDPPVAQAKEPVGPVQLTAVWPNYLEQQRLRAERNRRLLSAIEDALGLSPPPAATTGGVMMSIADRHKLLGLLGIATMVAAMVAK